jgi:glycosyltransferase involved in cell wall biosynthesis
VSPAKLRIVHTEASVGWGGQEIRILTEAEGMIRRGHPVTLLCPKEARIYEEALLRKLPVVALPIGRKNIAGLRALTRWLRANPVDVLNMHSSTDSWLAALAALALANPPPLVRTRHISAPIPRNWPTRWLYTRATARIVTTGEALRQELIVRNRFPGERIVSIPTGIDTGRFVPGDRTAARARLGLAPQGLIVGIVATLRSWKGHRYLLEAFAGLEDRNTRLLIVGDGPMRETLAGLVEALNLRERVIMPGNQRDVLPWLQAMDVFALPSYANEGVPQAILQAMACGLPVISTTVGGIAEAVRDGATGLLIEPHSAEKLRAVLQTLLHDESLRQRLGAAAADHAHASFGSERMLDAMETLFRAVCAAHG